MGRMPRGRSSTSEQEDGHLSHSQLPKIVLPGCGQGMWSSSRTPKLVCTPGNTNQHTH